MAEALEAATAIANTKNDVLINFASAVSLVVFVVTAGAGCPGIGPP
jgi:hypothetical protein